MESGKSGDKSERWLRQNMVLVIMVNPLAVLATAVMVTGILFGMRQVGAWRGAFPHPLSLGFRSLQQGENH